LTPEKAVANFEYWSNPMNWHSFPQGISQKPTDNERYDGQCVPRANYPTKSLVIAVSASLVGRIAALEPAKVEAVIFSNFARSIAIISLHIRVAFQCHSIYDTFESRQGLEVL
jgi:hypothetical protein